MQRGPEDVQEGDRTSLRTRKRRLSRSCSLQLAGSVGSQRSSFVPAEATMNSYMYHGRIR